MYQAYPVQKAILFGEFIRNHGKFNEQQIQKGNKMCQYTINLDNISYAYEGSKVLKGLSLKLSPGEHVGILGNSGCGKSTLLKIAAGLYEPDSGEVTVAGERVPEKIRRQVALVMQSNCLFPLSIRENICCGHAIPEKRLWAACESARLARWIESLPEGLDTPVGERGSQVSGGQAQRIQIARAICKDAPVILLDEPVSSLDRDTGESVLRALKKLTQGRTVIHVTHHPETLEGNYVVYRMEGGRLNYG